MFVKRLLQFNLVVSAVLAAAFIFAPAASLSIYGIHGSEPLHMVGRYFGTTHLSFAILLVLALRANDPGFLRMLVTAFFAGDLVGSVVLLIAQLGGVMNANGWAMVALSLLFALGYGFGALRKLPRA